MTDEREVRSAEWLRGFAEGARRIADAAIRSREAEEKCIKHKIKHRDFKSTIEGWLYQILATEGAIGSTLPERSEDTMSEKIESAVVSEQVVGQVVEQKVVEVAVDRVGLTFGAALEAAKGGARVARAGWNGKGMWVTYSPGHTALPAASFWAPANKAYAHERGGTVEVLPCMTMKTADNKILMGWLASQTDMLASDWEIVP